MEQVLEHQAGRIATTNDQAIVVHQRLRSWQDRVGSAWLAVGLVSKMTRAAHSIGPTHDVSDRGQTCLELAGLVADFG